MSMQRAQYVVTNFSTGGKFWLVSKFMELHALTLAACSYVLLMTCYTQSAVHPMKYLLESDARCHRVQLKAAEIMLQVKMKPHCSAIFSVPSYIVTIIIHLSCLLILGTVTFHPREWIPRDSTINRMPTTCSKNNCVWVGGFNKRLGNSWARQDLHTSQYQIHGFVIHCMYCISSHPVLLILVHTYRYNKRAGTKWGWVQLT